MKEKGYKDKDSEIHARKNYDVASLMGEKGEAVSTLYNESSEELAVYGYLNASTSGSLWRYKIVGKKEEYDAPIMFYTWEVDTETMTPKEWDAEFFANLPSSHTDLSWDEGKVVMGKTVLVLTSIITLGASLEAQAGLTIAGTYIPAEYFSINAGLGVFFSSESLSGGSGEGILEQNMSEETKALYNATKTGSAGMGGVRSLSNLKNAPDIFMKALNAGNTYKGTQGVYSSGSKTINTSKKILENER